MERKKISKYSEIIIKKFKNMKNLVVTIIFILSLYSCNERTVKQNDLVKRNKLYYYFEDKDKPFTGKSLDYFKKSGFLRADNEYKDGVLIHNKRYYNKRDTSILWKDREYWQKTGYNKHFLIYDVSDENKNKILDLESDIKFNEDGEVIEHKRFNTKGKKNKHIITEYYKGKNNPLKKEFYTLSGKTLTVTYENGKENEFFIDNKKTDLENFRNEFKKAKEKLKNN